MSYRDRDRCCILLGHRRDEDGRAEEELEVNAEGVVVLWVFVEEGVQDGGAIDWSLMERSVEVVDETVPE